MPALPGFTAPLPAGFPATKEAYADWAVGQAEALFAAHGPIDIVGHDWGALIAQRAAMLRPDLIRSWAISNAVIDPDYRGHRLARIWNTPVLGELFMALSKPAKLAEGLAAQGHARRHRARGSRAMGAEGQAPRDPETLSLGQGAEFRA